MAAQSPYYYFILFAILMMTVGFVSMYYKALETQDTSNLNYLTLGSFFTSMVIFLLIAIQRFYPIHIIFYIVSLVAIVGMVQIHQKGKGSSHSS
jgi:hypothetical protein